MTIDTKRFKDKIDQKTPNINLVPLLDVIFTIMIFLLVMLSQQPALDQNHTPEQISAKPTSQSGTSEYYLMPLNGLHKVTVNGVDKSEYIRNGAIAVHTRVMDEGQIVMDSKTGSITIKSPAELEEIAVRAPSTSQ